MGAIANCCSNAEKDVNNVTVGEPEKSGDVIEA